MDVYIMNKVFPANFELTESERDHYDGESLLLQTRPRSHGPGRSRACKGDAHYS